MSKNILILGNGYIGSYLYEKLIQKNYRVDIFSRSKDIQSKQRLYQHVTACELHKYDAILWFAGHSSVPICNLDPVGAMRNNVIDLYDFASRIQPKVKFIYASSASVYSGLGHDYLASTNDGLLASLNSYDSSKKAFDLMVETLDIEYFGLRMGTLSGVSPKTRTELIFNAMNIAAIKNKEIIVTNPNNYRTILFLDDLLSYVINILESRVQKGFINAGSVNSTIGGIAATIADFHNAKVNDRGETGAYSFRMKIEDNASNDVNGKDRIFAQCEKFKKEFVL